VSRSGVATALVCVANRYMHTPVEMVSLKDLELASRLVAAVVMNLTGKENFIP